MNELQLLFHDYHLYYESQFDRKVIYRSELIIDIGQTTAIDIFGKKERIILTFTIVEKKVLKADFPFCFRISLTVAFSI